MRAFLLTALLAMGVAFAAYAAEDEKEIPLKDGSSVVIFKDGKMSMRDKFGKAHAMPEGTVMETRDGTKIVMKGNEVFRRTTVEELNKQSLR